MDLLKHFRAWPFGALVLYYSLDMEALSLFNAETYLLHFNRKTLLCRFKKLGKQKCIWQSCFFNEWWLQEQRLLWNAGNNIVIILVEVQSWMKADVQLRKIVSGIDQPFSTHEATHKMICVSQFVDSI